MKRRAWTREERLAPMPCTRERTRAGHGQDRRDEGVGAEACELKAAPMELPSEFAKSLCCHPLGVLWWLALLDTD